MIKDVYFTLRTGFKVRLAVEETMLVGNIKHLLHSTKLTHFKPETMKFICDGKIINDYEYLPNDTTIVALAIVPIKSNNSTSCETILN
jgi:hypothetical protein|tara:strand:+ start:553 stop:816 length:264 start_codon:yes stop_codon:yes gene_type:complete